MGHIGRFEYSDIEDVRGYKASVAKGNFPLATLATLSRQDEMRKAMMLIYIRHPVDREDFKTQFDRFPEEAFPKAFEELRRKGLILEEDGKIMLSEKGDPWRFNIAWEFSK